MHYEPSTISVKLNYFIVMSFLTEKMSKLHSFEQAIVQASEVYFPVVFPTELRSSLRESFRFLSLPADTTMSHAQEDTQI
jgi:hypothetical protein